MPIQVASFIIPKAGNTWFILEDKYIKGGLQIVATVVERDAINPINHKSGMLVLVQADNKIWQLGADLTTWTEFKVGSSPVRQSMTHSSSNLQPMAVDEFVLTLGRTSIVLELKVDTPCTVEAFGTILRDETNPFKFVATSNHLVDDGSSLMTDGTVLRGRRHSILSNAEGGTSADIYFRVTNTDTVTKNVNLSVSYLPIEL
jgi:hypothetical protein